MDFFSLVHDLPYMFASIAIVWLIVAGITLRHIIVRKDIAPSRKWMWFFICLVPFIGVLFYGIMHYKHEKKVLWSTLFATVVSIVSFWYFAIHVPTAERDTSNKKVEQTATAQSIIQEFLLSEDSANKKYNNKIIEVSGSVEKVEQEETVTTVFLSTGIPSSAVSARLTEKLKGNLQNGAQVTIKGLFTGYIMGEIQLGEAQITKGLEGAQPTTQTVVVAKPDSSSAKTLPLVVGDTSKKNQPEAIALSYRSKAGSINFKATDEVAATNSQVISTITEKGDISFGVLIKGFRFEDALMQQHFNEDKYMNSDKYPKASFSGTISNPSTVNFKKDGSYPVTVNGKLSIHGVTQQVQVSGTITVTGTKLSLGSTFKVNIASYGINAADIAETAEITVSCSY